MPQPAILVVDNCFEALYLSRTDHGFKCHVLRQRIF